MGNTQSEANPDPNRTNILKQKVVKGSHGRTETETSSLAPGIYSKNLATQHVEEQTFVGSVTEDTGVKYISNPSLKEIKRSTWKTSQESPYKLVEPKASSIKWPIQNTECVNVPTLEKEHAGKGFIQSVIPPSKDNIDHNKEAGNLTFKETDAILPQVLSFPSVIPSNNSQLCTTGTSHRTTSISTQFSEIPKKTSYGKCLKVPGSLEVQKPKADSAVNQILKPTDTCAASPSWLLTSHRPKAKDMFDNVRPKAQPPKTGLSLLDGSQKSGTKDKAQTFVVKPSSALHLGFTKEPSSTAPSMDPFIIQRAEAENIKRETAEAANILCFMKTHPREDQCSSKAQKEIPVAKQVAPLTSFSYADALKQSLQVKPPQKPSNVWPMGAQQPVAPVFGKNFATTPKSLGKGEKSFPIKQSSSLKTTNAEKQNVIHRTETPRRVQFNNVIQEMACIKSENVPENMTTTNPKAEGRKQEPNASMKPLPQPTFTFQGEKPKFDWITKPKIPNEYFRFNGSCNREKKTQPFVPESLDKLYQKEQQKDKLKGITSCLPGCTFPKSPQFPTAKKAHEQENVCFIGTSKQEETFYVPKQVKPKQFPNGAPTFTFTKQELIAKNKSAVTFRPQATGSSKGHSSECTKLVTEQSLTNTPLSLAHTVISKQTKIPQKHPDVKPVPPKTMTSSPMKGKVKASLKQRIKVSKCKKSGPPVSHNEQLEPAEAPNSDNLDQSLLALEKAPSDEPTTGPEKHDNISMEIDNLDEAPEDQLCRKWKDFCVDNICTMKCRCKHCPGKLPPNVIRWLSVSENRLAEPSWITTLKLASSLVAGSKPLLDHYALNVPEESGTEPNEQTK